jgi:uncharacterized membrane protein
VQVGSRRGLERIVVFADAVVAIACTLLVLPLVDLATQDAGEPLDHLLGDHLGEFGAFALSFAVIARLWVAHHRLFERINGYDTMLVRLTLAWLFPVAFLPFPPARTTWPSGWDRAHCRCGSPIRTGPASPPAATMPPPAQGFGYGR